MLLRRLLKAIRKRLLKFECVRRTAASSLERLKDERQAKHKATLMLSGNQVRNVIPEKKEPYDTHLVKDEDGLILEYFDGRMIGHREVTPIIIRPFGMWKL